jgi:hypothetical protein
VIDVLKALRVYELESEIFAVFTAVTVVGDEPHELLVVQ